MLVGLGCGVGVEPETTPRRDHHTDNGIMYPPLRVHDGTCFVLDTDPERLTALCGRQRVQ